MTDCFKCQVSPLVKYLQNQIKYTLKTVFTGEFNYISFYQVFYLQEVFIACKPSCIINKTHTGL